MQRYDKCILSHERKKHKGIRERHKRETVWDITIYQLIVDTWRRWGAFDLSIALSWEEKLSVANCSRFEGRAARKTSEKRRWQYLSTDYWSMVWSLLMRMERYYRHAGHLMVNSLLVLNKIVLVTQHEIEWRIIVEREIGGEQDIWEYNKFDKERNCQRALMGLEDRGSLKKTHKYCLPWLLHSL